MVAAIASDSVTAHNDSDNIRKYMYTYIKVPTFYFA